MIELTPMYNMTMTGEAWIGMVVFATSFIFGILAVICKSERREAATKMVIVFAICGLLLIGHYFTKGSQEGRAELIRAAYNFPEKIK
jgi:multisubunit Na+/H+ antiporter MnhB subunit